MGDHQRDAARLWPGGRGEVWASDKWIDCALSFEKAHFLDGFDTLDHRFHFVPDRQRIGRNACAMLCFPNHLDNIGKVDSEHPFRLIAAPARNYLNTSFTETPTSQHKEGRPSALIHPDDLATLGIGNGQRIRMGNRRDSSVLHAQAFDGLQRGVTVVEGVWPNHAFEEGIGINALTSAEPGPPQGGPVFHDTAAWIRSA